MLRILEEANEYQKDTINRQIISLHSYPWMDSWELQADILGWEVDGRWIYLGKAELISANHGPRSTAGNFKGGWGGEIYLDRL